MSALTIRILAPLGAIFLSLISLSLPETNFPDQFHQNLHVPVKIYGSNNLTFSDLKKLSENSQPSLVINTHLNESAG